MNICGECTACCTLSVVKELNKKAWETCGHCILKKGCGIYGKHPQECRDFECAYLQGGNTVELRPDKCGIMFFKINEKIFSGVLVPDVPVTDMAKGQIESFNKQGYSVVLIKKGETPHIKLAANHDKNDIYKEYIELLKNGNI